MAQIFITNQEIERRISLLTLWCRGDMSSANQKLGVIFTVIWACDHLIKEFIIWFILKL